MEFFDRPEMALRRLRIGLATRLRFRKSGLTKLRQEVRTCEYEDVRVMWEILRHGSSGACGGDDDARCSPSATPRTGDARRVWYVFRWATRAPRRLCSSF